MGRYERKYLTDEELLAVQVNPNVAKATAGRISYTPEFKRFARKELLAGKHITDIFRDAGFDVAALGVTRIEHFKLKVLEFADPDFSEPRERKRKKPSLDMSEDVEDDIEYMKKRVRWLEHQFAYVQQEVEFVKKIQVANLEARKRWESKHRQK